MTTRKQDLYSALECRQPQGAVPVWELEFQAWDSVSGRHVVLGKEFEALTITRQEQAMHDNADIFLSVCQQMHFSAMTPPQGYWEQAPGHLAYYVLPGDFKYRQFEILKKLVGEQVSLFAGTGGVMTASYDEDFCEKLYQRPDEIEGDAQRIIQAGLESARRYRDLGAEAVVTASDIADNSGPFFNPVQMKRFILPYLHQWAQGCKAMGLYTILHSDGQLMPYMNAIADTAVDAIQAIDPTAGMDMLLTKQQVAGRLCLCGNIDCGTLLLGTPQQVFDSNRKLLTTCKAGGGLVLGASNAVQPQVPVVNYQAMIQAWREYGGYSEQTH